MRAFYSIVTTGTPKRDIDLFGETTVRIDGSREPGAPGVPLIYLSPYVEDRDRFAQRLAAALSQMGQATVEPRQAALIAPEQEVGPYSLPEYVEDVDWTERLFVPEDVAATDWKGWAEAFERRVDLATSSTQIAQLEETNAVALRLCPGRYRAPLGAKAPRPLHRDRRSGGRMIRDLPPVSLTAEEADLLRQVRPDQQLGRAAFAGQPFVLHNAPVGAHPGAPRFAEDLVLGMIAKGLLRSGQEAPAWPERNIPARPFTVLMTKEGERVRVGLLKHSRTVIAEPRAAA